MGNTSIFALRVCGLRLVVVGLGVHTARDTEPQLYFEVAAVVTTFILAGRYFEARAKQRSGAALRALLDLGPKTSRWAELGRTRVPVGELTVGDVFVVRPGEKIATDGVSRSEHRPSMRRCVRRRVGADRSRSR